MYLTPTLGINCYSYESSLKESKHTSRLCTMRTFVIGLCLLACFMASCKAQGCMIDKPLDFPNLSICGKPQNEFCQELDTQSVPDTVSASQTACLASPEGMITFVRLTGTCPCGFDDITSMFEHRYISIGGSADTIGTVSQNQDLGSRSTDVPGSLSGIMTMNLPFQPGTSDKDVLAPSGSLSALVSVSSSEIAPSLALRVCERTGSCDC